MEIIKYDDYLHLRCTIDAQPDQYAKLVAVSEEPDFYGKSVYKNKVLLMEESGMTYSYYRCPLHYKSNTASFTIASRLKQDPNYRPKVFISSQCARPRDVYRRTCDIVRDKLSADIVVMPYPLKYVYNTDIHQFIVATCHARDDEEKKYIKCYEINWLVEPDDFSQSAMHGLFDNGREDIKNYIERVRTPIGNVIVDSLEFSYVRSYGLLEKVPEYEDVLTYNQGARLYVYETDMPVDAPNKLTVEQLAILWRCSDADVMMKYIASSDWTQYPFTSFMFLKSKASQYKYSNHGKAIKTLWETLKHYGSRSNELVSPEDYSLFQGFILKLFNLNDGGFITQEKFKEIEEAGFADYIPNRVCIKRVKPDAPVAVNMLNQW